MILFVTGHRPDKLGGWEAWPRTFLILCDFAAEELKRINPDLVITGLAVGWDQAIAEACLFLKLPYVAAIPFRGQEARWSPSTRIRYRAYVEGAVDVEVVCEGGYAAWKMGRRNEWMVDRGDRGLALHDGGPSGGTFNCVEYARRRGKEVDNCWERWAKFHRKRSKT